jgi:hypothetical protein
MYGLVCSPLYEIAVCLQYEKVSHLITAAAAAAYCRYVWASLLPIVGGCSLSAMKEVSFSWGGFNNAMISNLGMVLRNIYSKKSLNDYKVRLRRRLGEGGRGLKIGSCRCPLGVRSDAARHSEVESQ